MVFPSQCTIRDGLMGFQSLSPARGVLAAPLLHKVLKPNSHASARIIEMIHGCWDPNSVLQATPTRTLTWVWNGILQAVALLTGQPMSQCMLYCLQTIVSQ